MAFRCPHCDFRIVVKTAPRAGNHTPKCPKCGVKFSLTVPGAPGEPWLATKIGLEKERPPSPDEDTVTMAVPPGVKEAPPLPASKGNGPSKAKIDSSDDQTELVPALGKEPGTTRPRSDDSEATHADIELPKSRLNDDETGEFELPADDSRARLPTQIEQTRPRIASPAKPAPADEDRAIPATIGGHEVIRELGRGGMGAVYLARQVSLDRNVALKVMNARWASDPVFLARFTREAFAAAQLVHHNVVQIHDIGEQEGLHFFSMEYVQGQSLGDLVKKQGPLPANEAVSHVIQAARGLKYAHDHGMIHRDVKPDNLMLNHHGVVKVADLGLVKTASLTSADDQLPKTEGDLGQAPRSKTGLASLPADMTLAHSAMGSPAFMSPEQCKNASRVDLRADIYSLGCTLYLLLTGKGPFVGKTVFEVMAKHATEPVAEPPEAPPALNDVLRKALAKSPDDRHQSMDELIDDLEKCLPGRGTEFRPTDEDLTELEESVRLFHEAPVARLRRKLIPVFFLGGLIAVIAGGLIAGPAVSVVLLALIAETTLAYFVVDGVTGKTLVFRKSREWLLGAGLGDWAMGFLGASLGILVLWLLGLHWVILGVSILAVGLAIGMHVVLDRGLASQRLPAIEQTEFMLRRFRLAGMDEETLRLFVAKNAGIHWEEFFEALFGYEAKLKIRPLVEEARGNARLRRHAAWREPMLDRIERAIESRRENRARKLLAKLESRKLQSEGVSRREAEKRGTVSAASTVERATKVPKVPVPGRASNARPSRELPKKPASAVPSSNAVGKALRFITGVQFRFIIAAMLIASGALWARQFKSNEISGIRKSGEVIVQSESSKTNEVVAKKALGLFETMLDRQPGLTMAGIDVSRFVDSLNPLIAGLILLSSLFYTQRSSVALCLVGAFIAAVPHLVIGLSPEALAELEKARAEGGVSLQLHQITMVAGLTLATVAFVIGYRSR